MHNITHYQRNANQHHNDVPSHAGQSGGLVTKSCLTLASPWTVARQAPLSMDFPDKDIGMDCHFLFQGNFLTQESNPGLLHCRKILYQLSHRGSPRILEWVANLFSRGYSQPRNEEGSPALQVDSLPTELSGKPQ